MYPGRELSHFLTPRSLARCVIVITPMRISFTHVLAPLVALGLVACEAAIITAPSGPGPGPGPGPGGDPEMIFLAEVQPLLEARCRNCHEDPEAAPVFLDPADYYASVLAYPDLVVPGAPNSSTLVTKGNHRGPAWEASEASIVRGWIQAEADAGMTDAGTEPGPGPSREARMTSAYPVDAGVENRIPLAEVGLVGAELVFTANRVASGMMLNDVRIVAASSSISFSHPRLVMWADTTPTMDSDRFSDLEMTISAGMSGTLTSSCVLVDFPENGELSVQFESASTL